MAVLVTGGEVMVGMRCSSRQPKGLPALPTPHTHLGLRDVIILLARHPPEQAMHRWQQLVAGSDGLGLAPPALVVDDDPQGARVKHLGQRHALAGHLAERGIQALQAALQGRAGSQAIRGQATQSHIVAGRQGHAPQQHLFEIITNSRPTPLFFAHLHRHLQPVGQALGANLPHQQPRAGLQHLQPAPPPAAGHGSKCTGGV